ncbi:MAG: tRNA lysidine(34) synthetase TilS [Alphaproteobacteria bacterium]|nr:tRNA lysidine(34) synthetase TilS [Alphaproteobacteria bacterium]
MQHFCAVPSRTWFASAADITSMKKNNKIAVGVSGGRDSMALLFILAHANQFDEIHALTVNHGLRKEAAKEAQQVAKWVKGWPHVTHTTLKYKGKKPKTKIQEEARNIRYKLLSDYCKKHKIPFLFLAHQADDQRETMLMRLARASGLDGLCGMAPIQAYNDALTLMRPLLDTDRAEITKFCKENDILYIDDPSNEKDAFERVRVRKAGKVLDDLGLVPERFATVSRRLADAREVIDYLVEKVWGYFKVSDKEVRIAWAELEKWPPELLRRVVLRARMHFKLGEGKYPPRREKLEALVADILENENWRGATFAGLKLNKRDGKIPVLIIVKEKA